MKFFGMISESAARSPAPAWVMFPIGVLTILVGVFVATNFRGIPKKWHESFGGREDRGFSSSYAQQRLIGVVLIAGGGCALVVTTVRLFS
ncbi:hypothetical protein [Streptomyces sp. NBC_01217]|uniref:hypothetical protein n=1 Tax=Streptomyces sp. NBC_01217 TaxID=2903779 RepID=UPI002E0DBB71|nr:hypothetical protein OG507_11315 [Streptomyces sp. NBC_01217]